MKAVFRKLFCICLLAALLFSDLTPIAQASDAPGGWQQSELDSYTLMLAAHALLGANLDELAQNGKPAAKQAVIFQEASPVSNPLEVRLRQVEALCAETRQSLQASYTGAEACERTAILEQSCSSEINALKTAVDRSRGRAGVRTFFQRLARRIDPGRANFGKLLRFIRHEVLPEAAQQIVGASLSGSNVVVRRVVRQTFLRKARQVLKANLTTDLLMSGVPPQTIQELGLPAARAASVDLSQIKIPRSIDLNAIREQCQRQAGGELPAPESQPAQAHNGPDMLEKWLDKNAIYMNCQAASYYYGTISVDEGAPESFDLLIKLDVQEGDVAYTYDYDATWHSDQYYENRHHGEGKGAYVGDGWFSGVEQSTILWYKYYLNTQTGEHISAGEEEDKRTFKFIGVIADDLSRAAFCWGYGQSNEEMKSMGKERLLEMCSPCTVEVR
jgi:hypothetical protein